MQILYATDVRSSARDAGRLLARLVDPARAEVTILSAHDPWTEEVDGYFAEVLRDAGKQMAEAGLVSSSTWRQGKPAKSIERELWTHPYDLVAVGAGNHGWLGRWARAGALDRSRPGRAPGAERGWWWPGPGARGLGADGSRALGHAIDTLTSVSGPARVDVIVRAVIETPDMAFATAPGVTVPRSSIEDAFREARALATSHLEEALSRIRAAGFAADGSLGEGWPGNDLLEVATDRRADLVVVGAHRARFFERLAMGSVSAHVTRHAPATLVASGQAIPIHEPPIEEPNGHVARNRYPVHWT
jgi:nucleotide-binding universal stress UspA family protein